MGRASKDGHGAWCVAPTRADAMRPARTIRILGRVVISFSGNMFRQSRKAQWHQRAYMLPYLCALNDPIKFRKIVSCVRNLVALT
jgi:hypothetical protein